MFMKKVKLNFAVLIAILVGSVSAFAFKPAPVAPLFGRTVNGSGQVSWNPVAAHYRCDQAQTICTASFTNNDPVNGQIIESSETMGKYVPL